MNQKKAYRLPDDYQVPRFLHDVKVIPRGASKRQPLQKGMLVSVYSRIGLRAGKWVFLYAEHAKKDGSLLIHVEGPISRAPRRRVITENDIKAVHRKSGGWA